MSYVIQWSSQINGDTSPTPSSIGKETITVIDSTTDSSTSLVLTGKNWDGYGLIQQENFIKLLENFASEAPPANPTIGQQWYNTATVSETYTGQTLYIYANTNAHPTGQWEPVYSTIASIVYPSIPVIQSSAPTPSENGVFWFDTANNTMYIYTNGITIPGAPAAVGNWTPVFSPGGSSVTSIAGTANQIAITGSGAVTLSLAQNVVIPTPSSGVPLSVTGVLGAHVLNLTSGNTGSTADIFVSRASSTANTLADGPNIQLNDNGANTASLLQHSGGQTELWQLNSGWQRILYVNTQRQVVINPPISGSALNVSGIVQATVFSGSGASLTSIPNSSLVNNSINFVGGTGISTSASSAALGSTLTISNTGVTRVLSGGTPGITLSSATGAVTITNSGVTSIAAGSNILISGATGNVTISLPANISSTAAAATSWVGYGNSPAAGTSSGNANTIPRSDANGYLYTGYINSSTTANENPAITQVITTASDNNFYRKSSISHLTASLSGTAPINITGNAASASTSVTQSSSNNSTDIATTAFVHLLSEQAGLAGNGYANFASGLQLRWGTVSQTVGGNQAHSFSTPFSNGCFVVIPVVASSNGAEFFTVVAGSQTASGWTQYSNNTTTINYLAIGY